MHQRKMFKRGLGFLLTVVFVFSISVLAVDEKSNVELVQEVEAIYQSIRNAPPKYVGHESIIYIQNEGKRMVATLNVPNTPKRAPIAIILAGFLGPRDGDPIAGTTEKYWELTSRVLAGQGFASLRLDFRGYGDSEGEFYEATFSSQLSDVIAAIDYITGPLKRKVNSQSIAVMGVSQGGMLSALTGARDARVDSLVLWSPVANPPDTYKGLITQAGMERGLALPDGGFDNFPLYIQGQYAGLDVILGKGFFQNVYAVDPVAEIRNYEKPLMVIVGIKDVIVWPQPAKGQLYLNYHNKKEMLVQIDADHEFDYWDGPLKFTDASYWSAAWLIKTLH